MLRDVKDTLAAKPNMAGHFAHAVAPHSGQRSPDRLHVESQNAEGRGGWRALRRVVLYAVAAAVVMVAAPLATLQINRAALHDFDVSNSVARVVELDRVRWLRVAPDPAVSPAEAGAALQAILPVRSTENFPARPATPIVWPSAQLTTGLFADVRTPKWWGPDASKVITRVAERVTPEELAFLETVATLPVWPLLDRAAHAARADVLGGRLAQPLASDANLIGMPVPRFGDVRTLAHAAVTRAAYYVARKDYAQAEIVLRNAASVGFLLVDDAPFLIDALMGRVMIGIVSDGLAQLYTLTGKTEGLAALQRLREQTRRAASAPPLPKPSSSSTSLHGTRQRLLLDIDNPALPRSIRWEQLMLLKWSTCAAPMEVVTGSSPIVEAAFDRAKRSLVRSRAEGEFLERMQQLTTSAAWHGDRTTPLTLVAAASAQVVSAVTGRPQLATCTRILAGLR